MTRTQSTHRRERNQLNGQRRRQKSSGGQCISSTVFKSISRKITKYRVMLTQKCHPQEKTSHPSPRWGRLDKDIRHLLPRHTLTWDCQLQAHLGKHSGTTLLWVLPGNCLCSDTYKSRMNQKPKRSQQRTEKGPWNPHDAPGRGARQLMSTKVQGKLYT